MENAAQLLEDSLLKVWNERNDKIRIEMMRKIYSADIAFYESSESPAFVGHQAINDLIGKLQAQWPIEFNFTIASSMINHDAQYVSWTLGASGEPHVASGADIAIVENDKIKSLYLLLNSSDK